MRSSPRHILNDGAGPWFPSFLKKILIFSLAPIAADKKDANGHQPGLQKSNRNPGNL
jgi:hypothetical protein